MTKKNSASVASAARHLLPGGVRLILVPRPASPAVTILVTAETGSKYEAAAENGLSHFLEHMCFKGTKKYKKPSDLSIAFDSLGAHYNAFTSHEFTGYYASVAPRQALPTLDLLAEMYLRPTFPEGELAKEKGVVIEEINMYEDLPHRLVGELFMSLLYGNTPAGRPIVGTKETVQSFTRDQLAAYHRSHYVAAATVVVIAGNYDESAVRRRVEELWAGVAVGAKPAKPPVAERQIEPAVVTRFKQSDQTHLVLGFRGLPVIDPRHYQAEVLANVLGGGMSSRLFRRIRDELGAAYYVRANNDAYTDHGLLEIAIGADNRRALEVIKATLEECEKLKRRLVPAAELERVKESMVSQLALGLETTSQLANFYSQEELLEGRLADPQLIAQKIRQVTAAELKALASRLMVPAGLNLALIGPIKEAVPFVEALWL